MTGQIESRAIARSASRLSWVGCAVLLLAGCGGSEMAGPEGPTGSVTGTATRKGAPLTSGRVTFVSTEDGSIYFGDIQSDGSFSLAGQFGAELPVGDYQVAVAPAAAPLPTDPMAMMQGSPTEGGGAPSPQTDVAGEIPFKYQGGTTSGITKTVAEGANDIDIDIPE